MARYLRDLVDEYWIYYGDGRSPLIDAPTWCVELCGLIELARAEKRAAEREDEYQREIAKKMGWRR